MDESNLAVLLTSLAYQYNMMGRLQATLHYHHRHQFLSGIQNFLEGMGKVDFEVFYIVTDRFTIIIAY